MPVSALPSVQQNRRAKLVATLGDRLDPNAPSGAPTTPPAAILAPLDESQFAVAAPTPPPAPGPAPTPPPTPAPAPPGPAAKSAAELERDLAEQRWNTLQGMFEQQKREFEDLKRRNEELERRAAAPVSSPSPTPAPSAAPARLIEFDAATLDPTPEEVSEYAAAFPVIGKLAKKSAIELVNTVVAPLVAEIQALKNQHQTDRQRIDRTDENTFLSAVRNQVPDFDAATGHAGWKPFLAGRVPFSSKTIGDALMEAHTGRDIDRVKEIFGKFREQHTVQPTEIPNAFAAPPASGASPTPQPTSKPTLKWSERTKAHDDFVKGRLTRDKLQQIDQLYKAAEAEGRIDYKA